MFEPVIQAIAAFNLICTGTVREGPIGLALPEAAGAPIDVTFRIDMRALRWCADDCAATEPIAGTFGEIVLRDLHDANGSHVIRFIPMEGRFTDTRIEGDRATLRSGACRPAPFGGFPAGAEAHKAPRGSTN